MVTWDEPKRQENLSKHKMDLAELEPVFDNPMISAEDARESYGELRLQSLGMWQGRVVLLVWPPRGEDTAHLISFRYADRKETDTFFSSLQPCRNRCCKGSRAHACVWESQDRLEPRHRHARWRCRRHGPKSPQNAWPQQEARQATGRHTSGPRSCRRPAS